MAFDILGALRAGANFGTGYLEGQQRADDLDYQKKFRDLSLQQAQNTVDAQNLNTQQQVALSDKAMQLFSPQNPSLPGDPATPTQDQTPPDPKEFSNKLLELANYAASRGDVVRANELATNAVNMNQVLAAQQQKGAAVQAAELKRQQISHAYVAQTLGAATNADEFNNAKMEVLSNPLVTPEEAHNLANLQYSPETVQRLRLSGMNSSQQASNQLDQLRQAEQERHNREMERQRRFENTLRQARDASEAAHRAALEKAGANTKAPSEDAIRVATPIVQQAMYEDNLDHSGDPNFTQAVNAVSARAMQITSTNKAVTYPQAVQMATQEAKANGELTVTPGTSAKLTDPSTWFANHEGSATYTPKGNTKQDPIVLDGKKNIDFVPGKWYSYKGRIEQYPGK